MLYQKWEQGYNIWRESFQSIEKAHRCSTFEQFKDISLAITDFINLSKPDRQVALHPLKNSFISHKNYTFCKSELESLNHLLYHCPFSIAFWKDFKQLLDEVFVISMSYPCHVFASSLTANNTKCANLTWLPLEIMHCGQTWLDYPWPWVSLTWLLCNLQLDDVTGANFENLLYPFSQSEESNV